MIFLGKLSTDFKLMDLYNKSLLCGREKNVSLWLCYQGAYIPRHAYMELSKILGKNKEDYKLINAYVNILLKLRVNACYRVKEMIDFF